MDALTFEDYRLIARAQVLGQSKKLTIESVDRDGTDINVLIAAIAAVGDEVSGQIARVEAALLLGSARGKDLDRVAFDRYGVLRKAAAPARGSVGFYLPAVAGSAFSIPAETLLQTTDGIQFQTVGNVVFPMGSSGPVLAAVRASAAGLATQAAVGTITNIISVIPGGLEGLSVTNTLATAGASDAENDDSLRGRALAFFLTARRGTVEAIRQGGLAVPGVMTANVFEAIDGFGRPARTVQLIVSDQFTEQLAQLAVAPPSYMAQSQVLSDAVFDGLQDVRAGGIFVDVLVGKVVLLSVVLALSFRAGVNVDSVALQARARVVGYINSLLPGQTFVAADAGRSMRNVFGLIPTQSSILSPSGNVVPMPLEVLRSSMGLVSASNVQPDRRLAGTSNSDAA